MDEKLYETFKPPERLTLMLQAMARQDDAEVERLRETCPRVSYTQADDAFEERVRTAFEVMAVICIDLRAMWAKLYIIEWSKEILQHFAPLQHMTATLGFIDGALCTQQLPQSPFFAADERPDGLDDDEKDEDEGPELGAEDFGDRMAAVTDRAERASADVLEVFDGAAKAIAEDLVDLWSAFDGFCSRRLWADARTVFAAWQMPLLDDVEAMLKLHADVEPNAEKVKDCRRLLDLNWDRRFGGDDHE